MTQHQLITASAGSGKTHRLTSRLLRLLEAGAPGRRVLASTFTRKAAGEIRERLMQRVARAAHGDAKALADLRAEHGLGKPSFSVEDARRLLRTLATGLGRQSVATLDSVLAGWTMAMAPELGLEGVRAIVDEQNPQALRLRGKALLAALHAVEARAEDAGIGRLVLLDLLERLHHGEGKSGILRTLDHALHGDLLNLYIEQPAKEAWNLGDPPAREWTADEVSDWVASAREAAKDLPKTKGTGQVHGNVAKVWQALVEQIEAGDFEKLIASALIIASRQDPGAVTAYKQPIEGAPLRLLAQAADHVVAALHAKEQHRLDATWLLLSAFDQSHRALKREEGILCFGDLPRLLSENPEAGLLDELAWRLDGRVEHLLLDEFQDTSRLQWKVLAGLAHEVLAGDARSLMVVGDPKQAIYAWRGGCSELMEDLGRKMAEQEPGSLETMARSFRSSPVVLEAVNRVFGDLSARPCLQAPAVAEAARRFERLFAPHDAAKADLSGRVRLWQSAPADDEKPTAAQKQAAHAAQVADLVAALAAENPGASIGILIRSRKTGAQLLSFLQAKGLPVRDEGGVAIGGHPAVAHALALLRLAELPDDTAAQAVVARGPLAEWFAADSVDKVRAGLRRHGLSGFVMHLARLMAPACDALAARRLRQLADLARQLEAGDPAAASNPGGLAQLADSARVREPGEGAVTVMTIHGSKGLEFDLVVLPDLDTPLDKSDARNQAVTWRCQPVAAPARVMRRLRKELQDLTPEVAAAHGAQMTQDRHEDICLLYVAMTRAKQGLEMVLMPPPKEPPLSYAQILRETFVAAEAAQEAPVDGLRLLHAHGVAALAVAAAEAGAPPAAPAPLRILWRESQAAPRFLASAAPSAAAREAQSAQALLAGGGSGGAAFGSAVHAVCQRLGFADEEPWTPAAVAAACAAARVEAGVRPAVAEAVLRLAGGGAAGELGRDGAAELRREWPFLLAEDDGLASGVFDRVHLWRDAGGRVVRAKILDFKTDSLESEGMTRTEAKAARAAHHRPQLQAYRRALARLTGCLEADIACVLLFTASGEAVGV